MMRSKYSILTCIQHLLNADASLLASAKAPTNRHLLFFFSDANSINIKIMQKGNDKHAKQLFVKKIYDNA